jgi:sporulation related protein
MSVQTPPAPPEPATRACPRCGESLTPDQEWCLNCGADVGARVAATPRWRVPVVLVGLLIAAALAAVALALVELADDDQQVAAAPTAQPQAAATPTPTPPPAPTGEQPAPGEAGSSPQAQVPEASDDQTATGESGTGSSTGSGTSGTGGSDQSGTTGTGTGTATLAEWPAGKTAWTVILESATSKSAAEQKGQELASGGTSVGVLHSDDFSSLNKGYWVVFSGQYDSQSAAQSALSGLQSKVSQAYVRHVVPKSA